MSASVAWLKCLSAWIFRRSTSTESRRTCSSDFAMRLRSRCLRASTAAIAITTGRAMTATTIHTIVLVAMAAPSFVRSLETAPSLAAFR
jgi:hypothetical protein